MCLSLSYKCNIDRDAAAAAAVLDGCVNLRVYVRLLGKEKEFTLKFLFLYLFLLSFSVSPVSLFL